MLKIKDNIDLKELENRGFKSDGMSGYVRVFDDGDPIKKQCFVYVGTIINPIIMTIPRVLYILTPLSYSLMNDGNKYAVDDLILAGLVEEVGE